MPAVAFGGGGYGWTALLWAAREGHVEALKYLIESAHVNKEATTNVSIMIIIDTLMNSESLMIIVHRMDGQLWMWRGGTRRRMQ